MGMSAKRSTVIHKSLADAIEDEVDAVEDVVGYISATELVRAMIAITIEISEATHMTRPELIEMFENTLLESSIIVLCPKNVPEA